MNVPRIFKKFSKEITPSYLTKMKNSSSIFPREKINSPLSLSVLFYHERKNASSLFSFFLFFFHFFFIFFVKFFYLFFVKIFSKRFFYFLLDFCGRYFFNALLQIPSSLSSIFFNFFIF